MIWEANKLIIPGKFLHIDPGLEGFNVNQINTISSSLNIFSVFLAFTSVFYFS